MSTVDQSLGAIFIGLVVCSLLHGVTLSQAWHFFNGQSQIFQDPLALKVLVAVVVSIDFIHQVCSSIWLYTVCVTNFGNQNNWTILPPSYLGMAVPTGFITVLVQGFYIWRIWLLVHKKWFIPSLLILCSLVQEGVHLYSMALVAQNPNAAQFTNTMQKIVIVVNSMGAGIDILIALTMVFLLIHRRTKVIKTQRVLKSLAVYSVTTGLMTSVCATMVLVSAVALPTTMYELLFYMMLSRMYSNSLLATLNVRDSIRQTMNSNDAIVTSSDLRTQPNIPTSRRANESYNLGDLKLSSAELTSVPHESISIKVDTTTEVESL